MVLGPRGSLIERGIIGGSLGCAEGRERKVDGTYEGWWQRWWLIVQKSSRERNGMRTYIDFVDIEKRP